MCIRFLTLEWFKNYLNYWKQWTIYDQNLTTHRNVKCDVSQGSISGPLLFLIYANIISKSSNLMNFILFADYTNLFLFAHQSSHPFYTVGKELRIIKLVSSNTEKTKFTLFHPLSERNNIPLKFSVLRITNIDIKYKRAMKFLGDLR